MPEDKENIDSFSEDVFGSIRTKNSARLVKDALTDIDLTLDGIIPIKKCPKCGGLLAAGFVIAGHRIVWDEKQHSTWSWGETLLGSYWSTAQAPAKRCEDCRIVIFEY